MQRGTRSGRFPVIVGTVAEVVGATKVPVGVGAVRAPTGAPVIFNFIINASAASSSVSSLIAVSAGVGTGELTTVDVTERGVERGAIAADLVSSIGTLRITRS